MSPSLQLVTEKISKDLSTELKKLKISISKHTVEGLGSVLPAYLPKELDKRYLLRFKIEKHSTKKQWLVGYEKLYTGLWWKVIEDVSLVNAMAQLLIFLIHKKEMDILSP